MWDTSWGQRDAQWWFPEGVVQQKQRWRHLGQSSYGLASCGPGLLPVSQGCSLSLLGSLRPLPSNIYIFSLEFIFVACKQEPSQIHWYYKVAESVLDSGVRLLAYFLGKCLIVSKPHFLIHKRGPKPVVVSTV